MGECIFCKIVGGQVPAKKILEDEEALAFLDINPAHAGHTLVIPKKHYEQITDIPDEELKSLIVAVKKTAKAIDQSLKPDGLNIHQSNRAAAGQVVSHAHFHVIPREKDDFRFAWSHEEVGEEKMIEVQEKIKSRL